MEKVIPATAASPADPNGLASPSPNDQDANVAQELLRNKYGESQWHDLIKPIADTLRERQRDRARRLSHRAGCPAPRR